MVQDMILDIRSHIRMRENACVSLSKPLSISFWFHCCRIVVEGGCSCCYCSVLDLRSVTVVVVVVVVVRFVVVEMVSLLFW